MVNFAMAHKEPAKISGLAIYDDSRPLEVHIFCSLSLLQENFEMDFLGVDLYHERQADQLKKFLLKEKDKFIEFQHEAQKLPIFLKEVEISYDENDEPLPPGMHFVSDVDISIVLLISTPMHAKELSGKWLIYPDVLLDLEKEYGGNPSPESYEIALTFVGPETITFRNSSTRPSFVWKNSGGLTTEPKAQMIEKKEIVTNHFDYAFQTAAVGFGLIFLYWVFSNDHKARQAITLLALINLSAYIYMTDFTEYKTIQVAKLPEAKELKPIIKNRLNTIYNSLRISQSEKLYDQLESVASKDFLDESYQDLHKSIFANNEVFKIVEKIDLNNIEKINDYEIKCDWEIQALIRHKNHIHPKNLSYSAIFKLDYKDDKWLITEGQILPVYEFKKND